MARAHIIAAVLVGALPVVTGCYTLEPVAGLQPAPGEVIALAITDAGRVALGGSMGPEIMQVQGRLIDQDTANYVLSVSAVRLLNGNEQSWSGERVRVRREYVSSMYERRFSTARTVALGAVGAGVLAAIAGHSLVGSGSTEQPTMSPGDSAHTQRRPRR